MPVARTPQSHNETLASCYVMPEEYLLIAGKINASEKKSGVAFYIGNTDLIS